MMKLQYLRTFENFDMNESKDEKLSLAELKEFDGKTVNADEWKQIRHSDFIKKASLTGKKKAEYSVIFNDRSEIFVVLESKSKDYGEYEQYLTDVTRDMLAGYETDKELTSKEREFFIKSTLERAKKNHEMNQRLKERSAKEDPELKKEIKKVWTEMETLSKESPQWRRLHNKYVKLMDKQDKNRNK